MVPMRTLMLGALENNMRCVKSSTALFLLVWLEQTLQGHKLGQMEKGINLYLEI